MIESVNNKQVKYLKKLMDKKYQDIENKFIVVGEHLVKEALKAGYLEKVILTKENDEYENFLLVSENVLKKITGLKSAPKILGICTKIVPDKIKGTVAILDNIQDPGNLGTIIRSACAFNIDTLLISNNSVNPYNQKVLRASEGMIFHQNFIICDIKEKIKTLKKEGYTLYTTDVKNGMNLEEVNFDKKTCIILGNEGSGVDKKIASLADKKINIKMNKECESLNVAVCASIIFYKLSI